jgi:hypothetical protein
MRILWLKTDLLLPLDKGGKLRTWHLMRHLARRHEISYLAFAAPDEPQDHIIGMREVAAHVDTVPRVEVPKASPPIHSRTRSASIGRAPTGDECESCWRPGISI